MDQDTAVRLTVYQHFAATGTAPTPAAVADRLFLAPGAVRESYRNLRASRTLVLEDDGETIRMAPPFSGVPTQHRVESDGVVYFANCPWDALGIPAALHRPAVIHSRCEQSGAPLDLEVGEAGPPPSSWIFHSLVPAARWWDDITFT